LKTSDIIIKYLELLGVRHVFVLAGGFSMHLNDSLNYSSITPIQCLHESGAGFAANGYAAYTSGLSVCLVTSGPGCTNAITACASAWQDNLPVLFLSGDAKVNNMEMREKFQLRQGGQQDLDIMHMVGKITKYRSVICDNNTALAVLDKAVGCALEGRRGPVWVSVPLDVQAEE
jgi:acetolactate synthase I/II/III large subunit